MAAEDDELYLRRLQRRRVLKWLLPFGAALALFAGIGLYTFLTTHVAELGAPCDHDTRCEGVRGTCLFDASGREAKGTCTLWCTRTSDCPSGYTCELEDLLRERAPAAVMTRVCVPSR